MDGTTREMIAVCQPLVRGFKKKGISKLRGAGGVDRTGPVRNERWILTVIRRKVVLIQARLFVTC